MVFDQLQIGVTQAKPGAKEKRAVFLRLGIARLNSLTPTVAEWVHHSAIKHPVPDRVKPSFVIFDIRSL